MAKSDFNIPQQIPITPGYYYSSEILTKDKLYLVEKKDYIGTVRYNADGENAVADNVNDHRYIYYIVNEATDPEKVDEYRIPKKDHVYILYTNRSIMGQDGAEGKTVMEAPAGFFAYFAMVEVNTDKGTEKKLELKIVEDKNVPVFCEPYTDNHVQKNVPKDGHKKFFDLRSYIKVKDDNFDGGMGYNTKLSRILRDKDINDDDENTTVEYWANIYSSWPETDEATNSSWSETDEATIQKFNELKNRKLFQYMSEIPVAVWNNIAAADAIEHGTVGNEDADWVDVTGTRFCAATWGGENRSLLSSSQGNVSSHIILDSISTNIRSRNHLLDCYKISGDQYKLMRRHLIGNETEVNTSNKIDFNDLKTWSDIEKLTIMFRYLIGRMVAEGYESSIKMLMFDEDLGWNMSYYNFCCETTRFHRIYITGTGSKISAPPTEIIDGKIEKKNNGQIVWDAGDWIFSMNLKTYTIFGRIGIKVKDFRAHGVVQSLPEGANADDVYGVSGYPYLYISDSTVTPVVPSGGSNITLGPTTLARIVPNVDITSLAATAFQHGTRNVYSIGLDVSGTDPKTKVERLSLNFVENLD